MPDIIDRYGRTFKTLRVSLLSACNLGCVYCTLGENTDMFKKAQAPVERFLDHIARLHKELDLETIRLTGGEPLLYHDLPLLIKGIGAIGIPEIKITTNGFLLERLARPLKDAGLQSVNVSLDAAEEATFYRMSKRRGLQKVLTGIEAAIEAGLDVKINTVIMRDLNDDQLLPLARFAFSKNIQIRFLEVMAMGHLHQQAGQYLYTQEEVLNCMATAYSFEPEERKKSATANYWRTSGGHSFGIIANESEPFCHDCNRLRLDAQGNIYGCLSSNNPISVKDAGSSEVLRSRLSQALQQKQALKFTGSELSMLEIGG
ncbi:GTP 3',8-cyclase MoaA [Cesiribacter sp. SM1]|uniref:GTP 3',8-cyclase MoaA n=1 Tax=Cesiribacter sp. SM1 TaxID=2861196 RepID=UPI001CD461ED|nr:radical SAM protein [Cesiribacter sp. SM1]